MVTRILKEFKEWVIVLGLAVVIMKCNQAHEERCAENKENCRLPAHIVYMHTPDHRRADKDRLAIELERVKKGLPRFADYPHLIADWEK